MFTLLLHPIPYFTRLGKPDDDIKREIWKGIVSFLGYHPKDKDTYPIDYDLKSI
jgi:hypothetical protein